MSAFSGRTVDHQLELRRLLDGQVGRLGALEDLIDVGCGAPEHVRTARPIRHEATDLRLLNLPAHRRQAALGCEVCDSCSVSSEERVRQDEEHVRPLSGDCREGSVEVVGAASLQNSKLHPQRPGRARRLSHHEWVAAGVRILEDGDPGDPGHSLFEQLQLFSNDLGGNARQPGDIAAGPREAGDEPTRNRIGNEREDDGDRPGRGFGGLRGWRSHRKDDVYLQADQLGRELRESLVLSLRPSVLNSDVPIFYVAKLSQPLAEGVLESRSSRGRASGEITYPGHFRGLLCLASKRRSEEDESDNDREPDPPHGYLGGGWLAGSLADVSACGFQRDEEQAAEAISHGLRARGPARATGSPGPLSPGWIAES